jgi:hypothetical protein
MRRLLMLLVLLPLAATAQYFPPSGGGGGGGTTVNVNGSQVSTPNFNGATPAAQAGYTNCTWQVSTSSVSCELPNTPGTKVYLFSGFVQEGVSGFSADLPATNYPTPTNAGGTDPAPVLDFPQGASDYASWSVPLVAGYPANSGVSLGVVSRCNPANCDSTNYTTVTPYYFVYTGALDAPTWVGGTPANITNNAVGAYKTTTFSFTPTATSGQILGVKLLANTSGLTAGDSFQLVMLSVSYQASGSTPASTGSANEVQTSDGGGNFLDSGCSATGGVATCSNGFSGLTAAQLPAIPLTKLANQAQDTILINEGASGPPTAVAMPACTTGAILYNTSTHAFSCVTTGGGVTDLGPISWVSTGIATFAAASSSFANATITTTASQSMTLSPANLVKWGQYNLEITNGSGAVATLTLGVAGSCSAWKVAGGGGGAITLSGASAIDWLNFTFDGTNCVAWFSNNHN